MFLGDSFQLSPIRGMSEHINGQNRFRFRCDSGFNQLRIDTQCPRVDVNENGGRALHQNAISRCDKTEWRSNNLVLRADSQTANDKMQRTRSTADCHGVLSANILSQLLLERL